MNLFRNLRFGVRTLMRNPALAVSAILAIGLGFGATTAMFSATDGILLHPLPFPQSERLVRIWESTTVRNIPKMVAAGLAIGVAGAALFMRFLGKMLFRVGERDPLVFAGAAAALVVVSAVACWLPARRASRVDPLTALRRD